MLRIFLAFLAHVLHIFLAVLFFLEILVINVQCMGVLHMRICIGALLRDCIMCCVCIRIFVEFTDTEFLVYLGNTNTKITSIVD